MIEAIRKGATSGEGDPRLSHRAAGSPALAGPASFAKTARWIGLSSDSGQAWALHASRLTPMNDLSQLLFALSYKALPLLFAMVLHEYAHGWVADKCGDSTAKMQGRLTINPLPHIDLFGTIIVPLICLMLPGSFLLGWAKPVPVDPRNMRHPRRDMALVAAAGPGMNFLLAVVVRCCCRWCCRWIRPCWHRIHATAAERMPRPPRACFARRRHGALFRPGQRLPRHLQPDADASDGGRIY